MNTSITTSTFLLLCALGIVEGHAQSDECDTATPLAIVAPGACGGVSGNNSGATDSFDFPACDVSTNGYQDVWYTFTTSAGMTSVTITLTPGSMADWGFDLRTDCFGASVACEIGPTGGVVVPTTPATQYWLQVFSNTDWGFGGTFTICVEGSGIPAPPNDSYTNATPLAYGTSCTPVTGTVNGAMPSLPYEACGSNAGDPDDDVWYSVPVTGCILGVTVDGAAQFDAVVQIWQELLGTYTPIACVNATGDGGVENLLFPLFTPYAGETYYVQVYDHGTGSVATPTFTICAFDPRPNDLCSGAITLPMSTSCTFTPGESANACSDNTGPGCAGAGTSDQDDGVWYKFVATSSDVRVVVDGNGTGSTGYDPVVALLNTNGCITVPPPSWIACADATGPGGTETLDFSGIIPGLTYHVLVYDKGVGAPGNTSFSICVQDLSGGTGIPEPTYAAPISVQYDAAAACVVIQADDPGPLRCDVFGMDGRLIASGGVGDDPAPLRIAVPNGLARGCYLVRMARAGRINAVRFVVP